MKYNPQKHHRRSIRLKGYDYSQAGLYFITICAQNRACLFGNIVVGQMILNDAGKMVEKWYNELENKFPDIRCHEMIIMPNHFHCIVENVGAHVGADLRVCPITNIADPNIADPNIADPNIADPNITDPNIADPNIADPNIADPNITDPNITDPNITDPNIADPNIADPNIADPNIADPNIADPNIADGNIADPNITDTNITDGNIADPNITDTNIADPNITDTNIADPNIADPNIADGNIADPNITDPNITDGNIADPNITDTNIADGNNSVADGNNSVAGGNNSVAGGNNSVADGNIEGEHVGSPLQRVVQWLKTMTTNEYIRGVKTLGWQPFDGKLWQRNYWEHIIRNHDEYQRISNYIINNPQKWDNDKLKNNNNL